MKNKKKLLSTHISVFWVIIIVVLTIMATVSVILGTTRNDTKTLQCKRVELINICLHYTLNVRDGPDGADLAKSGVCCAAKMYDMKKDELRKILSYSEEKEKAFMKTVVASCIVETDSIETNEFQNMARKALKATDLSKQSDFCFK